MAEAALRHGLRGAGTPRVDRLEVAQLMRVRLVGEKGDFSIQEINTQDQYVRPGHIARWDFGVTPLRSGTRLLRLLASVRIRIEGMDEVVDLPTYEREVQVAVAPFRTASQFLGKNWQWLSATIAIPLIVWVVTETDAGKTMLKRLWDWV